MVIQDDMSRHVLACVDASSHGTAVCEAGAWAAARLDRALTFIHCLEPLPPQESQDTSGQIGLGAREALLDALTTLDAERAKLAKEKGWGLLEGAKELAVARGMAPDNVDVHLRHGDLLSTLRDRESEARLIVLGMRGETPHHAAEHLGTHLERVVRSMHTPLLIVQRTFTPPKKIAFAFDRSETTRKGIGMLADSPLLEGAECQVLTVGSDTDDQRAALDEAVSRLEKGGLKASSKVLSGGVDEALAAHVKAEGIELLIMGAYGHSRVRHLLVGSTTSAMLRHATVPTLVLR